MAKFTVKKGIFFLIVASNGSINTAGPVSQPQSKANIAEQIVMDQFMGQKAKNIANATLSLIQAAQRREIDQEFAKNIQNAILPFFLNESFLKWGTRFIIGKLARTKEWGDWAGGGIEKAIELSSPYVSEIYGMIAPQIGITPTVTTPTLLRNIGKIIATAGIQGAEEGGGRLSSALMNVGEKIEKSAEYFNLAQRLKAATLHETKWRKGVALAATLSPHYKEWVSGTKKPSLNEIVNAQITQKKMELQPLEGIPLQEIQRELIQRENELIVIRRELDLN